MTDSAPAQIPDELQARRRPLRLRPVEGAPRGARGARRARRRDGHLAPPGAGQGPGRPRPRRARASCSRCPTATRSRSATAARPPSGTPPPPGLVRERAAAPDLRRVLAQVREGDRRARPFLADPIVVEAEPGDAPEPARRPGADAIAWAHNETSTGVMVDGRAPGRRRRRAGPDRRHLGRRRPAGRPRRRPTPTTSPRRRASAPTAASGWRCSARPRSSGSSELDGADGRWQPAFLSLATALENSRKDQTYNTPARRDPAAARRPARVDARPAAASTGASSARGASSAHLYGWAEAAEFATPFVADPAKRSLVVGTIDFDDVGRRRRARRDAARQRDRRHRALPQARAQPAADRDVPGGRARPTSRRSPPASTGSSRTSRGADERDAR